MGAWLPQGSAVSDPRGELCIRKESVTKATLYKPAGPRNCEVLKAESFLLKHHPHRLRRWRIWFNRLDWAALSLSAGGVLFGLMAFWKGWYSVAAGCTATAALFCCAGYRDKADS